MWRVHRLHFNIKWLFYAIGPVVGFFAALIAAWLIVTGVTASHYDDIDEILENYSAADFENETFLDDGSIQLQLKKNDIYYLADNLGILDDVQKALARTPGFFSNKLGFQITDSTMILYLFGHRGLAPISYEVTLSVVSDGTALTLHPEEVIMGNHTIDSEQWPTLLQQDFTYDFSSKSTAEHLLNAYTSGNSLILVTAGFSEWSNVILSPNEELLESIRIYGTSDASLSTVADLFTRKGTVSSASVLRNPPSGQTTEETAIDLAICSDAESRELFWNAGGYVSHLFSGSALSQAVEERLAELETYFAKEKSSYALLLSSVREHYKANTWKLNTAGHLLDNGKRVDLSSLSSVDATLTDSRIIYLTSASGDSVYTADMPVIDNVKHQGATLPTCFTSGTTYDIGILLTTPTEVPLLLHYDSDMNFCMDEISTEKYVATLMEKKATLWELE